MITRISGVILAPAKHIVISLQSIFGIGKSRAFSVCQSLGIPFFKKVSDLTQDELNKIQFFIDTFVVEGDLRRNISCNIKHLCDVKCYRGMRHRLSLPVRGQRTRTNASTRKKYKRVKSS